MMISRSVMADPPLERDVVVLELLAAVVGGGRASGGAGRAAGPFGRGRIGLFGEVGPRRAVAAREELELLDDDGPLRPLAPAVLVVPLVVLQPAVDEDRVALVQVLVDRLGRPGERGAV